MKKTIYIEVEETSVLLFLNKFDVIFFSTWLHLIGLFF